MEGGEASKKRNVIAFCIDVEFRGDSPIRHGILSIGVCIGPVDRVEVLHKTRFNLGPLGKQGYEEKCLREFWNDREDLRKELERNPIDPIEGIQQFRALVDAWDTEDEQIVIFTDNAAGDIRFLSYYLDLAEELPLSRDKKGVYRPIFDTDSYSRGVECMRYEDSIWTSDELLSKKYGVDADKSLVDHNPENDAEYIYRFHIGLVIAAHRKKSIEEKNFDLVKGLVEEHKKLTRRLERELKISATKRKREEGDTEVWAFF